MRHAIKILIVLVPFFGAFVLSACSNEHAEYIQPTVQSECVTRVIDHEYMVKYKDSRGLKKVRLEQAELRTYLEDRSVAWVEPNYGLIHVLPTEETFAGRTSDANAVMIGADYAWQHGFRGQGITVAVVDSGVDLTHPQLKANIRHSWNIIENNAEVFDETGHGTHIAGIIAGKPDSEFSGIAPDAGLIVADFMEGDQGDEFDAIKAIEYSLDNGARVVNNSWSNFCSHSIRDAFEGWQNLDVIFVNAAGNDGQFIDTLSIFPANLELPNSLAVGSVDAFRRRSTFSNYGRNVTVYAPGEEVYSLGPLNPFSAALIPRSGTSMSTAFVSGAMALVLSSNPNLTAARIVRQLRGRSEQASPGIDPVIDIKYLIQTLANPD